MHKELATLVDRMNDPILSKASVIPWACPVPSFGDLTLSTVATLGLNPSNREFVDLDGNQLDGESRRFHTLHSLGLSRWSDAAASHIRSIWELCRSYFLGNPYDQWFKKLDYIISGTPRSYYTPLSPACHLDLIPYATACKWTALTGFQQSLLLDAPGDTLRLLLKKSPVRLLVLNGKTGPYRCAECCGDSVL